MLVSRSPGTVTFTVKLFPKASFSGTPERVGRERNMNGGSSVSTRNSDGNFTFGPSTVWSML